MTFKERRYECQGCGEAVKGLYWDHQQPDPCVCGGTWAETGLLTTMSRHTGVIDDQLEGGARWCETMGHEPVWLDGTKSQWRREVERHQVVNTVRHDDAYYARHRRQHLEQLRDEKRAY